MTVRITLGSGLTKTDKDMNSLQEIYRAMPAETLIANKVKDAMVEYAKLHGPENARVMVFSLLVGTYFNTPEGALERIRDDDSLELMFRNFDRQAAEFAKS